MEVQKKTFRKESRGNVLEKQYDADELFQMGKIHGLSPEYLLLQEGDPLLEATQRDKLVNSQADEIYLRLNDALPQLIVECKNIEAAQNLAQVICEHRESKISSKSILFLHSIKLNIRWLLFGIGARFLNDSTILPPKVSADMKCNSALAELKTISRLSAGDILWIFGRNYQVGSSNDILPLSVSMLARSIENLAFLKFVPEMPETVAFIEKIESTIEKFKIDRCLISETTLVAIQKLKTRKAKLCLLFFVNRSTFHSWKKCSSSPRIVVERLMYILDCLIENFGDRGFAAYIELLDAEARSRGKDNFATVLDSGWEK